MIPFFNKHPWCTLALLMTGFLFSSNDVCAQNHIQLTYDYSIPTGGTRDYISRGSFRGAGLEFAHDLDYQSSVGLRVGLNTFYQVLDKDTYTNDNITLYGKQFRYLNAFPVLATYQFRFAPERARILPYIKLGTGAYYIQKRTDLGLYTFTNDYQWSFGLQPEAGVIIPINPNIGINVAIRYNYLFGNQSIGDQQYINIGVGIRFSNLGRGY